MMKRLYNYLIINLVAILLASCGTDLEPEIFPNRTIANGYITSFNTGSVEKIFVSESKIYFYSQGTERLITYDLATRTTNEMEIQMEVDESIDEGGYLGEEYRRYLLENLANINSLRPGGGFWYNGKGYVVTWDRIYIFSPETSTWTYSDMNQNQYVDGNDVSNSVFINNQMIQISASSIYYFSPETMTWRKENITRLFQDLSNRKTLLVGNENKLYAYDYYEKSLYLYDFASNLWQEMELNLNSYMSGEINCVLMNGNNLYLWISSNDMTFWELDLSKSSNNIVMINVAPEYYSQILYSDFRVFNIGNTCYKLCSDNQLIPALFEFELK